MLELRPSADRGLAKLGWLHSRHSFSFGSYYDPEQGGFSDLLVINDDRVQPGRGFDTHGHRDMEIFTYVLEGALEHKDSMGTGSVIRPGDVQMMSAGSGIRHSEFNASRQELVHFLQIWIIPNRKGVTKPVTLKMNHFTTMTHPMLKKDAVGANASTLIKRSEFNAGKHVPNVGDEVTITVAIEAIKG